MTRLQITARTTVFVALMAATGCSPDDPPAQAETTVITGATLWDGTGASAVEDAVLVIRAGRIEAVGSSAAVEIPEDATIVEMNGRYIVPGLINTHGHVGGVLGLESGHYTTENLERQLELYAAYGVTTVNSLGGDGPEGIALRAAQAVEGLGRARIYVAGAVVVGDTPDQAIAMVDANADAGVDWIKIRVDDNLGTTAKMTPEVFGAVIDHTHDRGLRLASHLFYLNDAKALLRAGSDFVAHSVRDQPVDDELVTLLTESGVCYSPTLTREVSTYVYGDEPEFFADEFFLTHADTVAMRGLLDPDRMRAVRDRPSAAAYRTALEVAQSNLDFLAERGVTIAFGTDTGPAGRFQGYFEHMEMDLMAEAGLTPEQILRSATGDASQCLGRGDIGVLEAGRWADLVVLTEDPLANIRGMRAIESVWVGGHPIG